MLTKTWQVSMVVVLIWSWVPLLASDAIPKPLQDQKGGCFVFESFREVFYPATPARRAWDQIWNALTGPPITRPLVAEVVVHGNQRVAFARIAELIFIKPGSPYEQSVIDADVRRVYDLQEFTSVQVKRQQTDDRQWVVTFLVAEYPQTVLIKDIEYRGVTRFTAEEQEYLTGLCRGRPAPLLATDIQREIERCYDDLGLFDARVERSQVQEEDGIRLVFAVHEGAPCRIRGVDLLFWGFRAGERARCLSGPAKAWLLAHPTTRGLIGAPYDEDLAERVVAVLEECYQCNGFLSIHVRCGMAHHPELGGGKLAITILDHCLPDN